MLKKRQKTDLPPGSVVYTGNQKVEKDRDMLNGLQDLYLSEISYKMNQVMQVLTLIATIFMPLTFVVGIYEMNFDYMPELHWKDGYFALWGIMAVLAIGLVILFKRKRWL